MTRSLKTKFLGAAIVAGLCLSGAQAQGFGDRLKKLAKKEAAEKVEDVIGKSAAQSSPQASVGGASASGGASVAPPSQDLMDLTQCSDLKVSNVMVGKLGEFTFQQGLSQEERTGFINRRAATPTNGCILPSIDAYEAIGRRTAELRAKWWHKMAGPLSAFLMPLLGAIAAFGLARSGQLFVRAIIGMALGFAYFVVDNAALAMGSFGGYPPFLAAWAPFFLFLLVGETVLIRTEE